MILANIDAKIIHILILISGVFISSVSQIILKKSADKEYPNKIREYLNVPIILAYTIFFAATLCTVYAYKVVPLSMGPILEASGYFFVAILSLIFIKEKISLQKGIGIAVIIVGIVIYSVKL